ncbi:hypothetical protein [Allobaculum mucilyticum]|uniref:hypothetical protein n=1 Tax=Allobaculum mucilyticum TaxID=2834459 RepID=UPI001E51BC6C|nr:hypothetical protein [Allobaculum mucilyticum]UNT95390.1 hypothetical protein KWG62_08560 [Allobaculum mucilyticum]UNT96993.1 hypothetical protein KWG62_04385 [Allobaculum mucilyticum]
MTDGNKAITVDLLMDSEKTALLRNQLEGLRKELESLAESLERFVAMSEQVKSSIKELSEIDVTLSLKG